VRPTKVYIPTQPMRVTSDALKRLSSLPQFRGIPDEALIRLAKRRTKLYVHDRWVFVKPPSWASMTSNTVSLSTPAWF
jgi:hypothetical protein